MQDQNDWSTMRIAGLTLKAIALTLFLSCSAEPAETEGEFTDPQVPAVQTRSASTLGTTAITVNGSVHPHGQHTSYYFEYGPSKSYGFRTEKLMLGTRSIHVRLNTTRPDSVDWCERAAGY